MKYFMSIAVMMLAAIGIWAEAPSQRIFTDEQWLEDIDQYVELVKSTHIAMYHAVSEEEFTQAVTSLIDKVPELRDSDIAMEMVAIAALIGDGHTWVSFGSSISSPHLPLLLYEFEDGVVVSNTLPGLEQHIGKRVVSIEGTPVEDLLAKTSRYTSRDNEWGLLSSRIGWLTSGAFLTHENIVPHGSLISVRLRTSDGHEENIEFDFIPLAAYLEAYKKIPKTPDSELPLYRQRGAENYWMEYLRKENTLFVKFNAVQNAESGPRIGKFTNEVLDFIDENKVRKLVIDVRHNSGGDGNLTSRMIREISRNERINQPGRLFVITGRRTFSAALMFTARMEKRTEVLFVGEPGRGKPNSYSEFNGFTLTHTGMYGSISSLWHEEGGRDDTREFIPVDISVPLRSEDYFAGRDPVLNAILAYKK